MQIDAVPSTARSVVRFDMYGPVHKGIRKALSEMLVRLGQMSPMEEEPVLADLEGLLVLLERHAEHEEKFVHPLLPSSKDLEDMHEDHARQCAELQNLIDAVRVAPMLVRAQSIKTLYLHFSVFVADLFMHMAHEERVVQPLLEKKYTDPQLVRVHHELLASIAPEELQKWGAIMLPAWNREEREAFEQGSKRAHRVLGRRLRLHPRELQRHLPVRRRGHLQPAAPLGLHPRFGDRARQGPRLRPRLPRPAGGLRVDQRVREPRRLPGNASQRQLVP